VKQSRHRAKPRPDLGVAPDVATDSTSNGARPLRGNRYAKMKLPHERDESAYPPGEPNPVTTQGARDVEQGKTDTDCQDAAGPRFDRKTRP
jgi:hypothetical protein